MHLVDILQQGIEVSKIKLGLFISGNRTERKILINTNV
jgi:hypothetical protein